MGATAALSVKIREYLNLRQAAMEDIADLRTLIYDYFQENQGCQSHFHAESNREEYRAYYNSMYLIQDTAESLHYHRIRGFSENAYLAYIEFWGVMQAVIVQQDAIRELSRIFIGKDIKPMDQSKWSGIRRLRDIVAGHPAKKSHGEPASIRSFMGRKFGGYEKITFERSDEKNGVIFPEIALGNLLDDYAAEAKKQLQNILECMRKHWS
jgi:hypothetical protein